jgi:hypothetical protein
MCGLKLLHETATTDSPPTFAYVPQKTIISLFTRLDNQIMELGGPLLLKTFRESKRVWPFSELKDPESFRTLESAYETFDSLLNRTLHAHRTMEMLLDDPSGFPDFEYLFLETEIARGKCFQYLEQWSRTFNRYLMSDRLQHERSSDKNAYVLQIWSITTKIFLSVRLTDAEETWDQFHGEFNIVVALAEAFIEASCTTNTSYRGVDSFSFHLGILSPLFLTSIRCRDSAIRRRAVHILSSLRRCEGLWDSRLAATVARNVIDAEEKNIRQITSGIETRPCQNVSSGNIQAHVRVKRVEVAYDDGILPQIKLDFAG